MRRAAKIDANQTAIVEALRAVGCSVQSLAELGGGVPDLLIGYKHQNILIEVKDSAQPLSKRKFTPDQKKWHAAWKGRAHLVETIEQAMLVVGIPARLRA